MFEAHRSTLQSSCAAPWLVSRLWLRWSSSIGSTDCTKPIGRWDATSRRTARCTAAPLPVCTSLSSAARQRAPSSPMRLRKSHICPTERMRPVNSAQKCMHACECMREQARERVCACACVLVKVRNACICVGVGGEGTRTRRENNQSAFWWQNATKTCVKHWIWRRAIHIGGVSTRLHAYVGEQVAIQVPIAPHERGADAVVGGTVALERHQLWQANAEANPALLSSTLDSTDVRTPAARCHRGSGG